MGKVILMIKEGRECLLRDDYVPENLLDAFLYILKFPHLILVSQKKKKKKNVYFRASQVAQWVKNLSAKWETQELRFNPWVGKIPWKRKWQPTPIFFPGESLDRGAWWATVHRVAKNHTQQKQLRTQHVYFLRERSNSWNWESKMIRSRETT